MAAGTLAPEVAEPTQLAIVPAHIQPWSVAAGTVSLLLIAEISGGGSGVNWRPYTPYAVQALLLGGGLVLTTVGLGGGARAVRSTTERWPARECLVVAAITMLAIIVRLWGLDSTLRVLIDETNSISHLRHVRLGSNVGLIDPPSEYVTTMMQPYWQATIVELVGHTLGGLRTSSAILGAATVPAVYALARSLFDRPTAMLAGVFLATFPPHVHFSRLGLPHILDPLFGTLAIGAVCAGVVRNRRLDWAFAGVALGLTHYGFEAGRLFFAPMVAVWIALMVIALPGHLRAQRRGIVTMSIAFLLTVVPVYYAALCNGHPIVPRLRASSTIEMFSGSDVISRLLFAASVLFQQPELADFYGGDHALVLLPLLPLFLIGSAALLVRLRSPAMIVVLWIAAAVIANAFMVNSAVYARWVVVLPAIALVLAVGLRQGVVALLARRAATWVTPAALVVAGVLAIAQLVYYFGPHLTRLNEQARRHKSGRDPVDGVLRAVAQLPPDSALLFISDTRIDVFPPRALLEFLTGGKTMTLQLLPRAQLAAALRDVTPGRHLAFFVEPDDVESVSLLRGCYPGLAGPARSPFSLPPDEEFTLYFTPTTPDGGCIVGGSS